MDFILFSTNVGSLGAARPGEEPTDEGRFTRKSLLNRLQHIRDVYGRYPDVVTLQETRNDEVRLAPAFDLPLITDENVNVALTNGLSVSNARRGVATYAKAEKSSTVDPVNDTDEIATSIHSYEKRRPEATKPKKSVL